MTQSFPWYKSYPAGVPHEINPDRYPSIPAVLDDIAARYPDKVGYTNMDCGLTYSRTAALTKELAAYLQSLGLKPGDRVAIMMPNLLQYVIAMYACLRAGYIVVNINPLYTSREVNGTLRDSEAKAIIIIENFAKTLQNALPGTKCEHIITTAVGDLFPFFKRTLVNFVVRKVKKMVPEYSLPNAVGFNEALEIGRRHGFTAHEIHNTDIAFLQYTGGTTGVAKGAILTHRNLLANLQQVGYWLASACKEGEEVALTALPLYHIFSLTATLSFTQFAANMVLITNPRDIDGLAKECAKWDFSIIVGVNTLFTAMLNNKIFCAHKFTRLKVTAGGGSQVQRTIAERWKQQTGCNILEAYGLTECSPGVCGNIPEAMSKILRDNRINVKIIEKDMDRCEELVEGLPGVTVDCGDGTEEELLKEEHIENMDGFVACTGMDEVNAILSMYALKQMEGKVVTKVNHVDFGDVIEGLQLDSVVNPKKLTAQQIVQYVRAAGNSMESNVETLYRLMNGRVEALEFLIDKESMIIGQKLVDMKIKEGVLIAGIVRNGRLIIPGGQDEFHVGDTVIVVTVHLGFHDIYNILA